MCSTEERDLIHSLYLHRFLPRGTKQSPSIGKSLVVQYLPKCQPFVLWTTFLYILSVLHSCHYMLRASWIPRPKFKLFIHNAGFTDPCLNRERKRDCWNISGWGNRKEGVKNKNSVKTRKKEVERFMIRHKPWLKVTLWIYWENIWKLDVFHTYDLSHPSPR